MADKKISDLTTASEIKNEDNIELSQSTGGGLVSLKATILALATKIVTNINFTSALNTTSKTITGAINEVAQGGGGGSSTLAGLTDVDIDDQTLADGQILAFNGTSEKWENGAGGGGTTVVANPTGTATADLETIQIGNVIYDIPGSGGGGSGYTASLVYDGSSQSTLQTSIELTEDYDKFDALYFFIKFAGDGSTFEGLLLKEQIDYGLTNSKIIGFAAFASVYAGGKMSSDKKTFTNIYGGGSIQNIVAVYGLKFGSGGSSSGVSGRTEESLWSGSLDLYTNQQITLSNSYEDYDELVFRYYIDFDQTIPDTVYYERVITKETLSETDFVISDSHMYSNAGAFICGTMASNTVLETSKKSTNWFRDCILTEIVGVKYGSNGSSGGGGVDYSLTEQDTGLKWVNGETIYQKTVYYAGGVNGLISFNHNISNLGIPLSAEGFAYDTYDGGSYVTFPKMDPYGNNIGIVGITSTQVQYSVASAYQARITDIYVTLRYTKSSS